MAILTTNYMRFRSELKTFTNAVLGTVESDYAAYELSKAEDTTKTWTVRVVCAYFDGISHVIIAEGSYPERNSNILGTVPEPAP